MFSSNTSQVSSSAANYVEDVFSTYLYTGNSTSGGSQTITNNIDLSTKGGLVWIKGRSAAAYNVLWDTARGAGTGSGSTVNKAISSNDTGPQGLSNTSDYLSAFSSSGFTVTQGGTVTAYRDTNYNAVTYASWTFRKQAKFFDVVTYTGTGSNTTVAHNLGSVPGCILVKRTDSLNAWRVYHTSVGNGSYLNLGSTAASIVSSTVWNNTTPTSTVFSVGTDVGVNASGGTYVAYLFAHNDGGFGLAGTDNVISCGSFTTDGSGNASVNLGYEPQWVLIKGVGIDSWRIGDVMRGFSFSNFASLSADATNTETNWGANVCNPTSTGFYINGANAWTGASVDYIYIAIRRGPMKTPTSGTSAFGLNARSGTGANDTVTGSAGVSDAVLIKNRGAVVGDLFAARLTGTGYLETSSAAAEVAAGTTILQANPWDVKDGVKVGTTSTITNASSNTYINYLFDRAPSFMDVVCYTGTGANATQTHNLGAVPELMIVKRRDNAASWQVYSAALANTEYLVLNSTLAKATGTTRWNSTTPTSSVFTVGTDTTVNASGGTYVAYLFATCAGVSKVGSYTGTGTTKQIDCGFSGGARFVLIRRTDSTGNWYVWDTARGIVSGNDPYFFLNTTDAEVTTTDYINPYSAGFEISSTAPAAINASGGTFIFLAIA